jgi:hypothetical protein
LTWLEEGIAPAAITRTAVSLSIRASSGPSADSPS